MPELQLLQFLSCERKTNSKLTASLSAMLKVDTVTATSVVDSLTAITGR